MKNIVIFNGAGKRNGNTAAMIQAFSDAAAANGNQITEFYLQTMTVRGCLNCGGCKRKEKGSAEPCVQRDDMNEIYPAFRDADVIVFASPVYWWDITGTLKTAIDRLYAPVVNDSAGGPKETVLLMTSGGSPIDHMLDWYRNLDSWLHWKSLGAAMNDTDEAKRIGAGIR
ncbi:MAG: flavodoxin family protein [Clostridia bacterium]|nr:flavodoxin family protein [Clostridia bacterium]